MSQNINQSTSHRKFDLQLAILMKKISKVTNCVVIFLLITSFLQFLNFNTNAYADPATPSCGTTTPPYDILMSNTFVQPFDSSLSGNNLYVTRNTLNQVAVINATTNTLTTLISTASNAKAITNSNGKAYVLTDTNTMIVISETTNTVTQTITLSSTGSNIQSIGNKVFVAQSTGVEVYDSTTDTLATTYNTGANPVFIAKNGNMLYYTAFYSGNNFLSIINTTTNTITATIPVGTFTNPNGGSVLGNKLYISGSSNSYIVEINLATNTMGGFIFFPGLIDNTVVVGSQLYAKFNNFADIYQMDTTNANTITPFYNVANGVLVYRNNKLFVNNYFGGNSSQIIFLDPVTLNPTTTLQLPLSYYTYSTKGIDNKYYIGTGRNVTVVDLTLESLLPVCPIIGTSSQTVTGYLGQTLSSFNLYGSNLANGTVITFEPSGSATTISGTFLNNKFIPDSGTQVPSDVTTGSSTGVLKSAGAPDLTVNTNFSLTPIFGTAVSNPLTGAVGQRTPTIYLSGSTLADGTFVQFTPAGSSYTMDGEMQSGNFVPYNYAFIPSGVITGPSTGVLSSAGVPDLTINIDFAPEKLVGTMVDASLAGYVGEQFPIIDITGSTIPDGTTAFFESYYDSYTINGVIQSGDFLPNTGELLPLNARIGALDGNLSVNVPQYGSSYTNLYIPTNFSHNPTADTDGDGLLDIVEDTDNNNLYDFGETNFLNADTDGDGANDGVEVNSPNNGDTNSDGTPDALQQSISHVKTTGNNSYSSLVLDENGACYANNQISATPIDSQVIKDDLYEYPSGLINFTAVCNNPGDEAVITLNFFGNYNANDFVLRKFNGVVYETLPTISKTNITIAGQPVLQVIYSITDGGVNDQDGVADGAIVDPVGIARLKTLSQIANTPVDSLITPQKNNQNDNTTLIRTGGVETAKQSELYPFAILIGLTICVLLGKKVKE
jgi:YVTN family beta-propeller protein